jgi:hypothetical protein
VAKGEVKLSGNKISFTVQQRFGTIVYDGEVAPDAAKLVLNIESKVTGWKGKLTFVHVPDQ